MRALPDQTGDTITVRFTEAVPTTGDPHIDAENQARAELEAVEYTLRTRVLPGARWEALIIQHPPTDAQKAAGYDYHPDLFPTALIAESVTGWTVTQNGAVLEDEVRAPSLEEAAELWSTWPEYARNGRVLSALKAQNLYGPALGKARSRRNATAATTPPATDS